ncbi:hypothetical protein RLIN73S_06897 [Rhodanobacter lindaniclasticus]
MKLLCAASTTVHSACATTNNNNRNSRTGAPPVLADFVCGGNTDGSHYTGANWERDARISRIADLRNVVEGDASPDGHGELHLARGIEVGHVFQLGAKYAEALHATVVDEGGKAQVMSMGCYGIGVTRIVAAAIEQRHDEAGIIWPEAMAPWRVAVWVDRSEECVRSGQRGGRGAVPGLDPARHRNRAG